MKFFSFILSILIVGCGTITGNPSFNLPNAGTGEFYAKDLICFKLRSCFPGVAVDCSNQVGQTLGLPISIGLPEYHSLVQVDSEVASGNLILNAQSANTCAQKVSELTCEDLLIKNSYDTSKPADFSSSGKMFEVDSSCQNMYSKKPEAP